jgi:uncharacterized membrane protein YesL
MYGDVILGMKPATKANINLFEETMEQLKEKWKSNWIPYLPYKT